MKYIFAGDSWAGKAWTEENYQQKTKLSDLRLATHWPWEYTLCETPGRGNLDLLQRLLDLQLPPDMPIIWVYTEPGRDYAQLTGNDAFDWIRSESIFEIRKDLDQQILKLIRETISNPIGLIGGLSDVNVELAELYKFDVLHPSWQRWIAETLNSKWFKFGWGASDIGWRMHSNGVRPGRAATFAWDEQIKEWCWWAEQGYFCHEHPTPRANEEFARYLQHRVEQWLKNHLS